MHVDGVRYYTHGIVPMSVSFPEGDICCRWCRACITDPSNRIRSICLASGEILISVEQRGLECPLVLDVDKNIEK